MYRSNKLLSPSTWLEHLENLLSHVTTSWEGIIVITGDMNIDLALGNTNTVTTHYRALLDIFNLKQMVTSPTRVTPSSRTLIDHIITNQPSRITHTGVIPCGIVSDHDGPYACINIRVSRYQPRYKYVRNLKNFDEEAFIADFAELPVSLTYVSDDPDEELDIINSLFTECLERHAPLRRCCMTRPPASWMECGDIRALQSQRDTLRQQAHRTNSAPSWNVFRAIRNKLKVAIRNARKEFMERALSSTKSKEVWRVVHRALKPNQQPLRFDPEKIECPFRLHCKTDIRYTSHNS